MSFIEKYLGFVQTRDQELSIALFKSIKLQLPRKLELVYIFWSNPKIVRFPLIYAEIGHHMQYTVQKSIDMIAYYCTVLGIFLHHSDSIREV